MCLSVKVANLLKICFKLKMKKLGNKTRVLKRKNPVKYYYWIFLNKSLFRLYV